ncbi:TonB-dependent receptor [Niveispirillum fermenti]|uniref:TonB-dependent receptor n=1 Tax=Niveispirillum fermenti TaxID=1233113 RepID=UPI003A854D47
MTKRMVRSLSVALCALAGSTIAHGDVQAQEAAGGPLEEIVVTATRFGSGLTRAAFALGADDIATRPLGADITQSLVKVPGIQVSTGDARGGSFSFEIYLRGLTDEQIGLTLDGIPTGDSRFNGGSPPQRFIESSNVARIDVSQSAGDIGAPSRFALGGFIDFITDNPRREAGATVEAGLGSFDFRRIYGRVDTGEVAPGLSAYLSVSDQRNDIWAGRNSRGSERQHVEFKAVKQFEQGSSISARVSYNDQTDNDFNIVTRTEYLADRRNDRASDALTGIPARDVDFGGALGGTREDWLAYVNARLVLTDSLTLSINPYYQTLDGESFRYQDRSRILAGGDPRAVTGYNANGGAVRPALTTLRDSNAVGGPADMRVTPRDRERYGVTSELKARDLFPGHSPRIGLWWEGGDSSETRNFHPITNPAGSIDYDRARLNYVEYDRYASVETLMLYVQDQMRFLDDRLKLDVGFTYYDITYDARSPLEYQARLKFSQDSDINPKFGASYRLDDAVELFGGYAQNFAGIPEDAFLGSTAAINPGDLSPVETENLDIGLRYVQGDSAFSIQAYQVKLKNNIGIVPRDPGVPLDVDEVIRGNVATRAANTAGQKTQGVEVTGYHDFGDVDLYASYSYQRARHDDPAAGSAERRALASLAIIGGAAVRDIPRHSLFAQAGWTPLDGLRLEANGRYVGRRLGGHIVWPGTFQEAGVEYLGGYALFGVTAQYELEALGLPDVRLQFNADNLFDRHYIASVSGATATQPEYGLSSGPGIRTLDRYFIGAPRTLTFSIRAQF